MRRYLNLLLNRVSMYKVVLISLTILFVIALFLSLVGSLAYTPLALIFSMVVLSMSVLLSSMLFGKLFGVAVHGESSFITGMILFFILPPSEEIGGLSLLVLAGMIAAASKFIFVYKGRHIFNPVAISAFLVGISGLMYATWWVATPLLILPTLLLGFIIMLKTRRLTMGAIFLVIATSLVLAMLVRDGSTVGESLILLLSWPLLFFAGFMLSEPLTMAHKKWQRTLEACVVAVLFAVPLHFGDFTTSPAFALLIGNLIAFSFSRKGAMALEYVDSKEISSTSREFTFKTSRPAYFEPGQYMEITVPHAKADLRGQRRVFSMTSAPGKSEISFGVKFYSPSSSLKKTLTELKTGSFIQSTGINGDFVLPKDTTLPLLLIAGGIGVTPFISHLRAMNMSGEKRDIVMLYAVKNLQDIAYDDFLQSSGVRLIVISSAPKSTDQKKYHHDVIQDQVIEEDVIRKHVKDITKRQVYISGPPSMIDEIKPVLKKLGATTIKTDYFIGY